jgi:glycosyltransferase involved in cell wall biosynthesis
MAAKQPKNKALKPKQTKGQTVTTATADVKPEYVKPVERDTYPIAFCIIASPEDARQHLQRCMQSLPANAQICILLNTAGDESTLTPVDVAEHETQTVRSRMWTYERGKFSFAQARNYAHQMATKDWVFWIDCDEMIAHAQHDGIAFAAQTAGRGVGGYYCGQASMSKFPQILEGKECEYLNIKQLRLYRREHGIQWEGYAHEQIANSVRRAGYSVIDSSITIIHNGYSVDEKSLLSKCKRNYQAIGRWLVEHGDEHELSRYFRERMAHELFAYNILEGKNNGTI